MLARIKIWKENGVDVGRIVEKETGVWSPNGFTSVIEAADEDVVIIEHERRVFVPDQTGMVITERAGDIEGTEQSEALDSSSTRAVHNFDCKAARKRDRNKKRKQNYQSKQLEKALAEYYESKEREKALAKAKTETEAETEPEAALAEANLGAGVGDGSAAGCGLLNDSDKKKEDAEAGKAAWKKIRNQKRKRKYKESRRCSHASIGGKLRVMDINAASK
jgi:hypothetical protein